MTGGVLPIAEAADHVVTSWDQNVQVHLPHQGVATSVEWRAGGLLCELLGLGGEDDGEGEAWLGRTFTTGATGSNVLGLACGREAVLGRKIQARKAAAAAAAAAVRNQGERVLETLKDGEGWGGESESVGELGLLEACRLARVEEFQVLTTMGHSSLSKAASIVGLGRKSVIDVGLEATPWKFDMEKLEIMLARERTASIVAVSCGEVNTGRYATSGYAEMRRLRELCDRFGAWLHVDGGERFFVLFDNRLPGGLADIHTHTAFGLFARALPPGDEFAVLREACEGIELADSITGDAHKCLNVVRLFPLSKLPLILAPFQRLSQHLPISLSPSVPYHPNNKKNPPHPTRLTIPLPIQPYDCGFFLTPSLSLLTSVFRNPNAAYLSLSSSTDTIPSPLNINIENSRRFRALPVYAVLVAHGRAGLADIFARQVRLARLIAAFISTHSAYELLHAASAASQTVGSREGSGSTSRSASSASAWEAETSIIVLFRAVHDMVNADLAARINRSGKIMVSGTAWEGRPAVRIAVSTWMVDVERDMRVVSEVLEGALF